MPAYAKTTRVVRAGFLAIVPAVLAAACSTGLIGSPETEPGEVEQLKGQVVELKKRATVAELEGDRLKRKIASLEAELEKARQVPEETNLEVEPTAPATIGLDQEIEETDLDEAPPVAPPPVALPPAEPVAMAEPAEQAIGVPTAEAQALYDEGYTLFHQKRYADAEARFSRYVELHPATDLADNALFWIGECRYARGDFSAALKAFSDTVERYPQSNKVGDALLKAGKCLESLGDTQQARRTYEEVMDRYPGSAAAARARDRLDALR